MISREHAIVRVLEKGVGVGRGCGGLERSEDLHELYPTSDDGHGARARGALAVAWRTGLGGSGGRGVPRRKGLAREPSALRLALSIDTVLTRVRSITHTRLQNLGVRGEDGGGGRRRRRRQQGVVLQRWWDWWRQRFPQWWLRSPAWRRPCAWRRLLLLRQLPRW